MSEGSVLINDSVRTRRIAQRHHWVNTITGMIDLSLHLSDDERYLVALTVRETLDLLGIPARGVPDLLPAQVVLEVDSAYYTQVRESAEFAKASRLARAISATDVVVPIEIWTQALKDLLLVAYPDLNPNEQLFVRRVFDDMLRQLGLPDRAADSYPDVVIAAYREAAYS